MHVYSFYNPHQDEAFHAWLEEHVHGRYRYTRVSRRHRSSFHKRPAVDATYFHSQTGCILGGWSGCSALQDYFTKVRVFERRPRFITAFGRHRLNMVDERNATTVFFDSPADMVLCKLHWHDHRLVNRW